MGSTTLSRRIVEALPLLDGIAGAIQPKVQDAVAAGGKTVRDVLDGKYLEAPFHPMLTDVPLGSWTTTVVFDGVDAATGSRVARNAADASLAFGNVGAIGAAITGLSDWRYLSGGSRKMGVAHGLLNTIGLAFNVASLFLRATGRRNAGRLAFLAGFSISGTAAHLGGELSYNYGLRVNRNVFEWAGPDEFTPVLDENELPRGGMRKVSLDGADVLVSRISDGSICAISNVCSHFAGPLDEGEREGDSVICPWHDSRFDLCSGQVMRGPATFPQSRWEVRVRDGKIEIKGAEENIQKVVR
ncbi:MAG: Rieske 2Fe-2S domain-containing protein [Rubrobacteraceae bacterium]